MKKLTLLNIIFGLLSLLIVGCSIYWEYLFGAPGEAGWGDFFITIVIICGVLLAWTLGALIIGFVALRKFWRRQISGQRLCVNIFFSLLPVVTLLTLYTLL